MDSSKVALIQAVRTLLPKRAWHRVSVQLICETAKVSRSTFYAHFDDKQDLLDLVFGALKTGLDTQVPDRGLNEHGTFHCLPWLVSHMKGHLPLFVLNKDYPSSQALFSQFRHVIDEAMRRELNDSKYVDDIVGQQHDFLVGGVFGTLEQWCAGNCQESAENVLGELDKHIGVMLCN